MPRKSEAVNAIETSAPESPVTAIGPEFGDQKLVSKIFGLTEYWLERDRWSGASGLPFYKVGSKVLYRLAEVASFIEKRRRKSTSDQGAEG